MEIQEVIHKVKKEYEEAFPVKNADGSWSILGYITIGKGSTAKEAWEKALEALTEG
jgi:hypothetical protein